MLKLDITYFIEKDGIGMQLTKDDLKELYNELKLMFEPKIETKIIEVPQYPTNPIYPYHPPIVTYTDTTANKPPVAPNYTTCHATGECSRLELEINENL